MHTISRQSTDPAMKASLATMDDKKRIKNKNHMKHKNKNKNNEKNNDNNNDMVRFETDDEEKQIESSKNDNNNNIDNSGNNNNNNNNNGKKYLRQNELFKELDVCKSEKLKLENKIKFEYSADSLQMKNGKNELKNLESKIAELKEKIVEEAWKMMAMGDEDEDDIMQNQMINQNETTLNNNSSNDNNYTLFQTNEFGFQNTKKKQKQKTYQKKYVF